MVCPCWKAVADNGSVTAIPLASGTPKLYLIWTSGNRTNNNAPLPIPDVYVTVHGISADSHVDNTASSPAYSDRTHIRVSEEG